MGDEIKLLQDLVDEFNYYLTYTPKNKDGILNIEGEKKFDSVKEMVNFIIHKVIHNEA